MSAAAWCALGGPPEGPIPDTSAHTLPGMQPSVRLHRLIWDAVRHLHPIWPPAASPTPCCPGSSWCCSAWEGRSVLVLDGWTAEQDPTFRRLFDTQSLPDPPRAGRPLIGSGHDGRYFDAADRVIHPEGGRPRGGRPGRAANLTGGYFDRA